MADQEGFEFLLHVKGNRVLCFLTRVLSLFSPPPDLWHGWGVPSRVNAGRVGTSEAADSPHPAGVRRRCPWLYSRKRGELSPENQPLLKTSGQKILICLTAGRPGTADPCLPLEALSSLPSRCPHLPGLPPAWLAASAQPLVLNFPQTPVPGLRPWPVPDSSLITALLISSGLMVLNTFYVLEDSNSHHHPKSSQIHLFWWPSWLLSCLRAIKLNMFRIESW